MWGSVSVVMLYGAGCGVPSQYKCFVDADGDGFGSQVGVEDEEDCGEHTASEPNDCDDADPEVGPPEGIYVDGDGDGFGIGHPLDEKACVNEGFSPVDGDCDDANDEVLPGGVERCADQLDNDCNDELDDADLDGDGFVDQACAATYVGPKPATDCDDAHATAFLGNPEVVDGLDNDCDGLADRISASLADATIEPTLEGRDNAQFGLRLAAGDVLGEHSLFVSADFDDATPLQAWEDGNHHGSVYRFSVPTVLTSRAKTSEDALNRIVGGHQDYAGRTLVFADGDLAVGSRHIGGGDRGRTCIIQDWDDLGPKAGLEEAAVACIEGASDGDQMGVLHAADFDQNGGYDLVLGSAFARDGLGALYVVSNAGSLTGKGLSLAGDLARWTFVPGDTGYVRVGDAAVAAQLSGGPHTDLLVGAWALDDIGGAYLIQDVADPSVQTPELVERASWLADRLGDWGGLAVAAGDFDCDSRMDVAFGAPSGAANGEPNLHGRVHILFQSIDEPGTFGEAELILEGVAGSDGTGSALAAADLTGDGCDDLLVGAPGDRGAVYLVHGRSTLKSPGSSSLMLSLADGHLTGEAEHPDFGRSLLLHDLDADGSLDLVVGATARSQYDGKRGKVYVFLSDFSHERR